MFSSVTLNGHVTGQLEEAPAIARAHLTSRFMARFPLSPIKLSIPCKLAADIFGKAKPLALQHLKCFLRLSFSQNIYCFMRCIKQSDKGRS